MKDLKGLEQFKHTVSKMVSIPEREWGNFTRHLSERTFEKSEFREFREHNTKLFMASCFSMDLLARSFSSGVVFPIAPQAYQ